MNSMYGRFGMKVDDLSYAILNSEDLTQLQNYTSINTVIPLGDRGTNKDFLICISCRIICPLAWKE